ncbi:copper amine oxidase N-terminal domain-containing protein [Fictibacillus arsenicus]|uniref:Copper amine oxidase-like N-terminal domain-containing protein n=1 Tax=Fictibacillus arsenicus TaxID=255247 RepID=A0A1V3GC32_9BACL|nr:copper amine oxidase N-terminal domain-containing protein [Fictibacillus arsenicus]OOE14429.1 hypothetical protein UN64_04340 [Fictibacillus arsenicus]
MKKILSLLFALVLIAGIVPGKADAARPIGVQLNGSSVTFDVSPVMENYRVLVPLRKVFEKMGGKVEWDNKTRSVIIEKSEKKISLVTDSKNVTVNGVKQVIDVPLKIKNGRALVPVRFVAETMGADVQWSLYTQTVYIFSGEVATALKPFHKGMTKEEIAAIVPNTTYTEFTVDSGRVTGKLPLYGKEATAYFDIAKNGLMTIKLKFEEAGQFETLGKFYSDKIKLEYGNYAVNTIPFYVDYSNAWEQYMYPINFRLELNTVEKANGIVEVQIVKILPDVTIK